MFFFCCTTNLLEGTKMQEAKLVVINVNKAIPVQKKVNTSTSLAQDDGSSNVDKFYCNTIGLSMLCACSSNLYLTLKEI